MTAVARIALAEVIPARRVVACCYLCPACSAMGWAVLGEGDRLDAPRRCFECREPLVLGPLPVVKPMPTVRPVPRTTDLEAA